MRALIWVVGLLSVLWGGYWFVGARMAEQTATATFADLRAQGLTADYTNLSVAGFPSRFDLTVDDLHLADPARRLAWTTPFAQVFSLSYKPWHVIAALPGGQVISLPDQQITVETPKIQASASVQPNADLSLDRVAVMADDVVLRSDLGWVLGWQKGRFATRQDGGPSRHEIGLELTKFAPDPALIAVLGLPATVDLISAALTAEFAAPLDRHTTAAQLQALDLREGIVRWGDIGLFAQGQITADAQGFAAGRVDLRIENWPLAFDAAVAMGIIPPNLVPTANSILTSLAAQSGKAGVIELPLSFQNGFTSFGPLPIGPAPRLR